VSLLILVVDDKPDVEVLFRQQFRRDLRAGRFVMDFAQSAPAALQRIGDAQGISLILILSDINMPGMTGLELLPKAKALRPDVPVIMITAYGDAETKRRAWKAVPKPSLPSQLISWRSAARSTRGSNKPPDETDSNRVTLAQLLRDGGPPFTTKWMTLTRSDVSKF
jgi:CheY-like chemotaxis protein